jgi:hypothetical protein
VRILRSAPALVAAGAVAAVLAAGCATPPSGLENLVPVKGKVVITGKPALGGNVRSVALIPDASKGNASSHRPFGEIDADGNFEIVTANRKGAPPGHYKVAVYLKKEPIRDSKNMYAKPEWLIDEKYGDENTSELTLHVVENAPEGAYVLKIAN